MIIEKAVKAGDLPEYLRAGADPEAMVLVSVQRLTVNGFTEEFEQGVLEAEKDTEGEPFRPARDVIKELEAIIAEDEGPSRQ